MMEQYEDENICDDKGATRRIQRTLKAISEDHEWGPHLLCRVDGSSGMVEADPDPQNRRKKQYWKWADPNKRLLLPGLGVDEALAILLIQERLAGEIPPATRQCLEPYFEAAKRRIEKTAPGAPHRKWLDKIAYRPSNQPLLPAKIKIAVQEVVLGALHEGMQLRLGYRSRGKDIPSTYTANPLGIIMRGPVTYLVCTLNEHTNPILLALHRITAADLVAERASIPKGFSLKQYIAEGGGDFGHGEIITLEVLFDAAVGEHLEHDETPLSVDEIIEQSEDRYRLIATVPDTLQLRWWLVGFGPRVEVIKPLALRDWVANEHRTAFSQYDKGRKPAK
jgi:predicted DNA-binding transcriptional regulator YafY